MAEIHIDDKIRPFIIWGAALVVFTGISTLFFGQIEYRDYGQIWVYLGLLIATVCIGLSVSKRQTLPAIAALALLGLLMVYSQSKFEWRRAYIEERQGGKVGLLDPFMTGYPSFESYVLAPILGNPDPVRLTKDCLEPMQQGQAGGPNCTSFMTVQDKYNIDLRGFVDTQYQRMKATAQKMQDGTLKTNADYATCVNSRECAPVPLLPPDVKATTIDPQSGNQFLSTRRAYWSLLQDNELTADVCEFMDLCRVLAKGKLMTFEKPAPAPVAQ